KLELLCRSVDVSTSYHTQVVRISRSPFQMTDKNTLRQRRSLNLEVRVEHPARKHEREGVVAALADEQAALGLGVGDVEAEVVADGGRAGQALAVGAGRSLRE